MIRQVALWLVWALSWGLVACGGGTETAMTSGGATASDGASVQVGRALEINLINNSATWLRPYGGTGASGLLWVAGSGIQIDPPPNGQGNRIGVSVQKILMLAGGRYRFSISGTAGATAYIDAVGLPRQFVQKGYIDAVEFVAPAGVGQSTTITVGSPWNATTTSFAEIKLVELTAVSPMARAPNGFYLDPGRAALKWIQSHPNDPRAPVIRDRIAPNVSAIWYTGWEDDAGGIAAQVKNQVQSAAGLGQLPVLVPYRIPGRDCGNYAKGGFGTADNGAAYKAWIGQFAMAIGNQPAIVVLEPDILSLIGCNNVALEALQYSLLNDAVVQFKNAAPGAWLYIDAGHAKWDLWSAGSSGPIQEKARRLIRAGVANARGFALNISYYASNEVTDAHGQAVLGELSREGITSHFVTDVSRNGTGDSPLASGVERDWCDPYDGRKIGAPPSVMPAGTQPELRLWVKDPGRRDGCFNGTQDGNGFYPDLAYFLATGQPYSANFPN